MSVRVTLAALLALLSLCACARNPSRLVQVKGSDTMVNLGGAWAEAFEAAQPGVGFVAVTGGGSGTGIAALINGSCELALSSRPMKSDEKGMARARGREVEEHEVAIDALVVVVHPTNPVAELPLEAVSRIYRGEVRNWREVGGRDAPIHLISRERSSGTHVCFLEEVVRLGKSSNKGEFAAETLMAPSSEAVHDEVAANESAIGYYGMGYLTPKNRALRISKGGGPFIAPTAAAAQDKSYPIARPLFIYTAGQPGPRARAFLTFVKGPLGQRIVAAEGFVPLVVRTESGAELGPDQGTASPQPILAERSGAGGEAP